MVLLWFPSQLSGGAAGSRGAGPFHSASCRPHWPAAEALTPVDFNSRSPPPWCRQQRAKCRGRTGTVYAYCRSADDVVCSCKLLLAQSWSPHRAMLVWKMSMRRWCGHAGVKREMGHSWPPTGAAAAVRSGLPGPPRHLPHRALPWARADVPGVAPCSSAHRHPSSRRRAPMCQGLHAAIAGAGEAMARSDRPLTGRRRLGHSSCDDCGLRPP